MFRLKPQPRMLLLLLLLLVVVGLFSCSVESLRFDLQSGLARCIAQEMKRYTMTVGNYTIINPNEGHPLPDSHNITVRVSSHGKLLHLGEHVQSGQFAFVAEDSGDYVACFWGPEGIDPPVTLSVEFDWRTGFVARDWSNVAKKRNLDRTQLELHILHETVVSIHEEMTYLREGQDEVRVLNETTNSKMFWLSLASFFVCFSVAGLQLWHLKTFFEKKKLI